MKEKVLVAGGAGFIGSHLCDLLLAKGHSVTIIDSYKTGRKQNIQHLIANKAVEVIEHDIRMPLPNLLQASQIYNLASPASPKDFATIGSFILETGSLGQKNLLELAKTNDASILFASTSEVYGDALVHPQPESYFGNVNPIGARACYDEAKRYGEALSTVYKREFNVRIRIARIFNTYGPRMAPDDGRIIPNFFTQALARQKLTVYGDGAQTRSYCYVSDMALGLYALMNSNETTPVNIGNPIERTVKEMATIINKLTGNNAGYEFLPLPENDPKQRRPDITKAQQKLGWNPTINLERGLDETLKYFKNL